MKWYNSPEFAEITRCLLVAIAALAIAELIVFIANII